MTENKYGASSLWTKLSAELYLDVNSVDLNCFRVPGGGINSRLASWDPIDSKSYRYYKNILYGLVIGESECFRMAYKKIGNTSLGGPVEVSIGGLKYNLDYVFSVHEVLFLKQALRVERQVVEIGAGFGRTCHAIIRNYPELLRYTIIDIPEILELSRRYLFDVLSRDEFEKVDFVESKDAHGIAAGGLYVNIDSMQEMDPRVALNYLDLIDANARYFYSRNAVCKYRPEAIGLDDYDQKELENAMMTGLCQDVVDIFDSEELSGAVKVYLERYSPGRHWSLMKSEESLPWRYYHHALYVKN